MSYHIKISEIHNTSKQMVKQTDRWINQLDKVKQSLVSFANTTAMSGEGADAIRAYILEVHIQSLDWIINVIETFRSSLILYVDGYEDIESDSNGEISQDILEEQLQRLQNNKFEFQQIADCMEQIFIELNQYMNIEGVDSVAVETCYDNAIRYVEETRTRVGEYEEAHSHDLYTVDEMIQHINHFLEQHTNTQFTDITVYQRGNSTKTPEFQKIQQLNILHKNYVTMVSDKVCKCIENRKWSTDVPMQLKYVAARGAFFKEPVIGTPKLKGVCAIKIKEIVENIHDIKNNIYYSRSALTKLNEKIYKIVENIKGMKEGTKFSYNWMKEGMSSSNYVTLEFLEKVSNIACELEIDPDDLMAVMAFESGFNPAAKNPNSSATGLIQFMSNVAISLGTTTEDLSGMSNIEQLDYVYKYYKPYAGKMSDLGDVYMVTLWPAAVGKSNDYAIFKKGDGCYEVNYGLDYNEDGIITKEEATMKVEELRKKYE